MVNPYQAPVAMTDGSADAWESLRVIAQRQRWLNLVILGNIGVIGSMFVFSVLQLVEVGQVVFGLGSVIMALLGIVVVFMLARALSNVVVAVLCALLMLVPCVSLLVMLALSMKASSKLKNAGVYVGPLGASPESIEKAMARKAGGFQA